MTKEKRMDINRETAMALWTKRYGKAIRVKDFSGREIDKGSYDNRNSKYGWNLDHILPKSRGGKDTESNLICVHIETNDEKADKFPVFSANGQTFEIIKAENHYEIKERKTNEEKQQELEEKGINFFDHSAALKFLRECETKKHFVGTIYVKLNSVRHKGMLLFIKELFSNYEIDVDIKQCTDYWCKDDYEIFAIINDVETKKETNNILDCCVLLNTYLGYYFLKHDYISSYCILNQLHHLDYSKEVTWKDCENSYVKSDNLLIINDSVRINTYAQKENLENFAYQSDLFKYDYFYKTLKENLERTKK